MRKIQVTFIIALFYLSFSYAQKVNLDKEYINVNHIYLPSAPILDETLRTYIVDSNVKDEYAKDELLKKIMLHGFEKRDDAGTISVNIEISGILIQGVELSKREKVNKDKEGNVTSIDKYYTPIITYKSTGYAKIINEASGKSTSLILGKKLTYKASEYTSYKKASEYFKLNKENLTDKFQNEFITGIPHTVNKKLNNKFGYRSYNNNVLFWFLGSKKNDDYESQQKAIKNVKSLLGKLDPNHPISDALKSELQDNIDYFLTIDSKYPEDDKKHRKMRYSSYFNIAMMYYHFDMPDKAIEYAEKLIANDYDKGDGKKIIKISESLKADFELNNINTRHFEVLTTDNTSEEFIMTDEIQNTVLETVVSGPEDVFYYISSNNKYKEEAIAREAINAIKIASMAWGGIRGPYLIDNVVITDKVSNRVLGQKFISPMNEEKYLTINLNWSKDTLVGAELFGYSIKLAWEGDKPTRIIGETLSEYDYLIQYNTENEIIALEGQIQSNGEKTLREIEYNNGKITSVTKYRVSSYKKWMHRVFSYSYDGDVIKVNEVVYKKGKSNIPKNEVANNNGSYQILSDNKIDVTHMWGDRVLYCFDESDLIKSKERTTSYGGKWLYTYTWMEGKLYEEESLEYKDGVYKEKQIIRSFALNSAIKSQPEYKWEKGKYKFDANDNIFYKYRDGKYNEKENGVWSGWKNTRY